MYFAEFHVYICFLQQAAAIEADCHFCLALFTPYELHVYLHAYGGVEFAC